MRVRVRSWDLENSRKTDRPTDRQTERGKGSKGRKELERKYGLVLRKVRGKEKELRGRESYALKKFGRERRRLDGKKIERKEN